MVTFNDFNWKISVWTLSSTLPRLETDAALRPSKCPQLPAFPSSRIPGIPLTRPKPPFPAFPALLFSSRRSPRAPFPALLAALALRAASPARAATVSAAAASVSDPAHAAALLGCTPRPREPYAADWLPPQPAPRIPQCGAAAPGDWPRTAKARPPLARAAGGSRRPGRAWVAFLVGGGGRAVRVSLLWSGCGQLGQAAGAIGRCWARRALRGPGGRCGLREGAP